MSSHITITLIILIVILNIYICSLLSQKIHLYTLIKTSKKFIYSGVNILEQVAKDNLEKRIMLMESINSNYKIKFNIIEKLDLLYIERSNIKKIIPFINIYTLLIFEAIIFILFFNLIFNIFYSIIVAMSLSILIALIPFLLLDAYGKYNSEKIRKMMSDFLTILRDWVEVRNDLLYAFNKSIQNNLQEPLNTYLKECVVQIEQGVDTSIALDLLSYKVNNNYFYRVTLNLKQTLKSKGNLLILLSKLQDEALKLEDEYSRRKLKSYFDRLYLNGFIVGIIFVFYYSLFLNEALREIYIQTAAGRVILNMSSIMLSIGLFLSLKTTKFDF